MDLAYLVFHRLVVFILEVSDIDYHVDFFCPIGNCVLCLIYLHGSCAVPIREADYGAYRQLPAHILCRTFYIGCRNTR